MAGRGPRLAIGLVGALGLVGAFIATTSFPFLGLSGFLILAAVIAGTTVGVDRRLRVQLVTHHDIDAFTKRGELVTMSRIYGLLPSGDLETLRARLHDFVDWKGVPGERVYVSPRVLFPFLGPPRVKPVRIPPPAEIERVTGREDLRKLAKALHVSPTGSMNEIRARVHAAVVDRMRRRLARAPPAEPPAFVPKVSRIPVEALTNADALRAELLRVMKEMGDVEVALNARVRELESRLEAASRERTALKARHEAVEAKWEETQRKEKETSALAVTVGARESELAKLEEEVKASAVLLTREIGRVTGEVEETRPKEKAHAAQDEDIALPATGLTPWFEDVAELPVTVRLRERQ